MTDLNKTRLRGLLKTFGWVLLIQFVLFNISAAIYAYKLTHFYSEAPPWNVGNPKNGFDKTWKLFKGPSFAKAVNEVAPPFPVQTLSFVTSAGLRIEAWHAKTDRSRGTVCLFHGLTSNKAYYLDEAQYFKNAGYNVLLLDFRGHGRSEGMASTIGYLEAEEVRLAMEYLQSQGEKRIFLFGGSMGAVAVARAVAVYSLRPAGIILEMPFDGLVDHIRGRARAFGFQQDIFALPVNFWIGIENSFSSFHHSTSNYAQHISCPVLLQWGSNDHLVTASETESIYKNLGSVRKKLVVYEDCQHSSLYHQDSNLWQKEVGGFLEVN